MITFNIVMNILLGGLSLVLIIVMVVLNTRHAKKQEEIKRKFLEEEDAANSVRKKEIDPALFYTADLTEFPPLPEGDPAQVARAARRTMVYFAEPVTNLELKKQYGPVQLDVLAQYEENFSEYLKALTKWAKNIAEENPSDALKILEKVISYGGEFRDTYKLAADIYAARGDRAALEELRKKATENHFKDPSILIQILEYIGMKERDL